MPLEPATNSSDAATLGNPDDANPDRAKLDEAPCSDPIANATGPLAGLRVIDLTTVVMGPLAVQVLGDLGADIIKIEDANGDLLRQLGGGPHREMSGMALNLLRKNTTTPKDSIKTRRFHCSCDREYLLAIIQGG